MVDTATDISNPEVLVREKLDELISFRNENQDIKEKLTKKRIKIFSQFHLQ